MKNLIFVLCLAIACLFTGCQTNPKNTLHVFIWSDYLKSDVFERFQREYDCEVIVDTYDSNEAMYAKLKLGGGGYDVIFPSNYFMEIMQPQGMLKKIDKSKIANLNNLDPRYLKKIESDLLDFGIPYMMSSTGLLYRKDKIVNFDPSWGVFGNSDYKGRMTMLSDIREVFASALSYLGYSVNTTNEEEIKEATSQILAWKKNLAKFESEQYKNGVASGEFIISQGYNGDSLQVMRENPSVAFAYPKEGISMSMDFAAIPVDASNPDLAYAFVNYLLKPEIAAENIEYTYFLSPNVPAYALLPAALANDPVLFPPDEILEKAEFIHDLGAKGSLYNRAWDKIKAE
jgi:spermidine/putrescine transport system substrate-binding protein